MLASIETILVLNVVLLTSIDSILEKCVHLQVQYVKGIQHASIVTILVSFEAILKRFSVRINFKSQFQSDDLPQALKYIEIASKLTSIVPILANIVLAGEHIFQVLGQYL